MKAVATAPIMDAHAQVSYLRDEKNVSFKLMSEEDAVAFLEERSFFFKLKAFAKDFEKYGRKAGGTDDMARRTPAPCPSLRPRGRKHR